MGKKKAGLWLNFCLLCYNVVNGGDFGLGNLLKKGGELALPADYIVLKPFNNNVVLAQHEGIEKILIKKGIGFGAKVGEQIPAIPILSWSL